MLLLWFIALLCLPRANKGWGYFKNLNDSIFGRIVHANELHTVSDTVVQKSPFNVHWNSLHPNDVKPERHDQIKSSDNPTSHLPTALGLLTALLDLGICPKILRNGPGPWDLGKWEDDLGIWAMAAPTVVLALNKIKTEKIMTLITKTIFLTYFCLKTHIFFRTIDVSRIAPRRRFLMSCLHRLLCAKPGWRRLRSQFPVSFKNR